MLLNFFTIEDFKDSFPFTALGARVCYNSGDLNSLLNDPRVVEKQKEQNFYLSLEIINIFLFLPIPSFTNTSEKKTL